MPEEKKIKQKRDWVYIILFALFCPISICALIASSSKIRIDELVYSEAHLLTIIGVLVTVVGLVITVYFIVLAISASRLQKEIEETQRQYYVLDKQKNQLGEDLDSLAARKGNLKTEIDSLVTDKENLTTQVSDIRNDLEQQKTCLNGFTNSLEQARNIMQDYSKFIYDDLDVQLAFAAKLKSETLRDALTIKRARLAYKYPLLDTSTRIKLLLELGNIGQQEDANYIQKDIIDNAKENEEIKAIARVVLNGLKEKLGITQ